ncbi:hypothetical protein LTR66_010568 [Elasticomyces elasticus]|nr:hypothetical protein LTR66_010568 [Elasticomyces elasticus]KAK4978528.1 hypothetical protein LTR28_005147 [Elasticomyces elasticus]
MSFFKEIRRVWHEQKDDDTIIKEAAGRQAVFNTHCRFKDFGFYTPNSTPFYTPKAWSSALPNDFKVCQECFKVSIAPTSLARSFSREVRSSKESEQVIECVFSRPFNEPAWRACVEQGQEAPLAQWLQHVAMLETSLSRCPGRTSGHSQSPPGRVVEFRTLRKNASFRVCEYHFAAVVQGSWMEDEFVHLRNNLSVTTCDFGLSEAPAVIALTLAKRSFNFKMFEDWVRAYQSLSTCNGIIDIGNKKYTLPTVRYTSAKRFQVCETCYRLVFAPHATLKPYFLEISGAENRTRGVCTTRDSSALGYTEALLKATWKHDPVVLLDFARDQASTLTCPGPDFMTKMRVWYGSDDVPGFICCECCFQTVIIPSALYVSFGHFPEADCQSEHCCAMAGPQANALFAAACRVGRVTAFRAGLEEMSAKAQADSAAELRAEQDGLYPENDLSKVRGTALQIQEVEALRDETLRLKSEAQRLLDKGRADFGRGLRMMGYGNASALIGERTTARVYDGHATWFDNSTQANASAMMIEGRLVLQEASRLERLVRQRRILLTESKRKLTPIELS